MAFVARNFSMVDNDTGEVFLRQDGESAVTIRTVEGQKRAQRYAEQKDGSPLSVKSKEDGFIWCIFNVARELHPEISPASLTRLIYIATFVREDGLIVEDLKGKPMSLDKVRHKIDASDATFWRFWKEVRSNGVVVDAPGGLAIDRSMFRFGGLDRRELQALRKDDIYISKVWVQAVRYLYENASERTMKQLSVLFRIMPFVNRQFNVVCWNPLEERQSEVRRMTLAEVAEIAGYKAKDLTRFQSNLMGIIFERNGRMMNAVNYTYHNNGGIAQHSLYINPYVYYGGNRFAEAEILGFDR